MKKVKLIRKLIYGVFLVVGLILATSCEDWLELIPPDGLVQNEYWKYKEDVEATLMGAYQTFARLDRMLFLFGEIRADMVIEDVNTPGNWQSVMDGNIFPDNVLCNWNQFYLVINYCNYVLTYAPQVYEIDPTFTEYQLRAFEAEAIFLRSLTYFYLLRIFRDVPLVLEPSQSDAVDFYLPKSSDSEILNHIRKDLDDYFPFVREDYGSVGENRGRASKGAFLALMADMALWEFEYETCIDYISRLEKYEYALLPAGKWFEIFYPGNSLEGIFEFQFDDRLSQSNGTYDLTFWLRDFLISESAIDLLNTEISREVVRGKGSLVSASSKIWKYAGMAPDSKTQRSSAEQRSCNWIVYRLADIMLMKAEALSQTGQYEAALSILNNEIRSRARMNPLNLPYTAEAFEDAILEERAKELAFEGKRWFDLLRMGRRNDFTRRNELVQIIIEKVPSIQKMVLASKLTDPLGWYMPIWDEELERNSALEQNPYYAEFSKND